MNEEELMRMVVRLIGDTESYQKMFQLAAEEAAKLQKVTDDLTRTEKLKDEAIARGVEVTKSVEQASEAYSREMKELNSLLKNGEIAQETYARSTQQSKEALKGSSSAFRTVESSADKYEREVEDLTQAVKVGAISQKQYNQNLKLSKAAYREAGNSATKYGQTIRNVGSASFLRVTAPILGLGAAATFAGVEIQTAFAGVKKTVDVTEGQLQSLKQEFQDFITRGNAPFSLTELLGTAETAGQLGIDFENIVDFTKTVENLKLASNLGEEAGESLARIANITELPQAEFSNLGSSIVALGNTTATTERDIVNMTLRLAGAGRQVGLSVPQITALSASLSSVGIEAEAGGTAFSQLFLNLTKQVATGGKELGAFAQTAGMTIEDFSDLFRKDAAGAVTTLLRGLNKLKGDKAVLALEDMGIEGIRLTDALLRSSGAVDLMADAMATSEQAFAENTALAKEAEVRYTSFSGVLKNAKAQLALVGAEIFNTIEPALRSGINLIKQFAGWFRGLSSSTKFWIISAAAVAASIPPILIGLGSLIIVGGNVALMFGTLSSGAIAFSTAGGVATVTVGGLTIALGALATKIALVGGALVGIGLAVWAANEIGKAVFGVNELNRQLEESKRLANEISKVRSSQFAEVDAAIAGTDDPAKKIEMLSEALDLADKNAAGLSTSAEGARKRVEKLSTVWKLATGNKLLTEAENELREVEAASSDASARALELRKELSKLEEINIEVPVGVTLNQEDSEVAAFSNQVDKIVQQFESELASIGLDERATKIQGLEFQLLDLNKSEKEVAGIRSQIDTLKNLDTIIDVKIQTQEITETVEKRIEEIKVATEAIGLDKVELEIFNLENLGATKKQLETVRPLLEEFEKKSDLQETARKRKADADKLIEQFLPPKEKFEKRKAELESLLNERLIDQSTFDSAVGEAEKTLDDLTKKDHKVNLGVNGLDAVEAGSAEALARVQEFLNSDRTSKEIKAPISDVIADASGAAQDASQVFFGVKPGQGLPGSLQSFQDGSGDLTQPTPITGTTSSTVNENEGTLVRIATAIELLVDITDGRPIIELESSELTR